MNRVQNTKTVLWSILGLAGAVGLARFLFGLGATTNLTDTTPWGFWIGFDVMAGVALAGGGFVITAIFYMFRREGFHDLVKPAVLTAFLGYLAVMVGLMFDLGLPWNIWHMMIYWNPHSPLFEVGWCVMLYSTVLLLEFSPVPLEEASRYAKIRTTLMRFRFPLVLLGIMLSTLHQSSLGSLFLIMPHRLPELWYSAWLPVQFLISAVALGLMMVSLESIVSHWLYRRPTARGPVAGLAKAAAWVLLIYLSVKLVDIAVSGEFGLMFDGSWQSNLFLAEILISAVIPISMFVIPRVRHSIPGQAIGSALVVFGIVFNRVNVGGIAQIGVTGSTYLPSWMELAVSFGVVSAAGLVFLFAIEHFHIWDHRPMDPEAGRHARPRFGHAWEVWLGTPEVAARTRYSLAFVLAFAVGQALIPESKIESRGIDLIQVDHARGGDTLFVDGNRDGYGATFAHDKHIDSLGQEESCVKCHHMNMPQDEQSGCWECHSGMYTSTDAFRHDWHADPGGGNIGCTTCHPSDLERTAETAAKCNKCHTDLIPEGAAIEIKQYMAPAYADALHGLCLTCHEERAAADSTRLAMGQCATCHAASSVEFIQADMRDELRRHDANPVVLPRQAIDGEVRE